MAGMKRGITAMAANDSGHANAESFWLEFLACIDMPEGVTADTLQAAIGDFYENEFGELGADVKPNPAARAPSRRLSPRAIRWCLPPCRCSLAAPWSGALRWAGIDPAVFSRITVRELHRRQA